MSPIQFVSLGPGEAELITLKGLKALQNADCIFCPETPVRDGHSLSRAADIMLRLDPLLLKSYIRLHLLIHHFINTMIL